MRLFPRRSEHRSFRFTFALALSFLLLCCAVFSGNLVVSSSAEAAGAGEISAAKAAATPQKPEGELKVTVLRNGEPATAYCRVYRAGEGEGGAAGEEQEPVQEGPVEGGGAVFQLAPGSYDVMVEDREDVDTPSVKFPGITIQSGASVEKKAEFSGGALKMLVFRNGLPHQAYCDIFKSTGDSDRQKEKVTENWIDAPGGTVFKLTPGVYYVRVKNVKDSQMPEVVFPAIAIKAGETKEQSAEFLIGELRITVLGNGKPVQSIHCGVRKMGEDGKEVGVASSYGAMGAVGFTLSPGVYSAIVTNLDAQTRPSKSLEQLVIEPGGVVTRTVDFPEGAADEP
jgi:hypothetical protein